jgi:hypothetical protein
MVALDPGSLQIQQLDWLSDVRTLFLFNMTIEGANEAALGPLNDDEQMERLQVLMQERAEQQEQRQQNFDEQNFGGLARGEEVVVIDMNQLGPSSSAHQEEVIMLSSHDNYDYGEDQEA